MEKPKESQKEIKIGEPGYVNKNCWLAKNLNYPPSGRCQYCQARFPNCLFFRYSIISLILIIFLLAVSFLIEHSVSKLLIISIFVLVIVYGYFFDRSTEDIVKANFAQGKAKKSFEDLSKTLQQKVEEKTKELQKALTELQATDKAKSEFISMASHQLRTPLTSIKGYLSMIQECDYGKPTSLMAIPLSNISLSTERLIKLVNDLLSISKIELGSVKIEKKPVKIKEVLQSCFDELKIKAKEKKLKFVFQKPKKKLPEIIADELAIRQIILNLLDNAIHYTLNGKVVLSVEADKNNVLIKVQDTGRGIAQKEMGDLFKSFSRGAAGINLFVEGTGLGLSVAKKYTDLHQGKIWAQSSGMGKGSVFFLQLPITSH